MANLMGVGQFERLFRKAASLDVDKADSKRLSDFLGQKLYDMLLVAQAKAKANHRVIIEFFDLPIKKGLQKIIHEFRRMEIALELKPILEKLATLPQLDLEYSAETREKLPEIIGPLTVALARAFKMIDPEVKNPQTHHWDRSKAIFNTLL